MNLLYSGRFDGLIIVSSDSDFTGLVILIKEQGVPVYGFGMKKTPQSFSNACSRFTYIENLQSENSSRAETMKIQKEDLIARKAKIKVRKIHNGNSKKSSPDKFIKRIFKKAQTEYISVADLGTKMKLFDKDFHHGNYGYRRLTDLLKAYPEIFELKELPCKTGNNTHLYVKLSS